VRVSPTSQGKQVTGNEVGRSTKVTGDEPGTCKSVTGTEYLSPNQYGAFCGTKPEPGPRQGRRGSDPRRPPVSGNMVGRSAKVTGDELGAESPTGTQYTAPSDIGTDFAPPKVGVSTTLRRHRHRQPRRALVEGHRRRAGQLPRLVTGDEYIDRGQYEGAASTRSRSRPVGSSVTNKGQRVSGTQTGRSGKVTGDEPGTCKAITGTPYAGLEQAADYCEPSQQREIQARTRPMAMTPGPSMTGIQPGSAPPEGADAASAAA
jgi:hypothetical protein